MGSVQVRVLAAVLMLAAPAAAGEAEPFLDCAGLADGETRLACFDAAAVALREARAGAAPKAADLGREQVARSAAEPPSEAAPERLAATLLEVAADPLGKFVVVLSNGQVWKQTEQGTVRLAGLTPGAPVEIEAASMGGYFLRVDGRSRLYRVRRIR